MRKILIGILLGFTLVSALAWDAYAQMCGCGDWHGSGMQGGMMKGMEHPGMGATHGMGCMQAGGMMDREHPMWANLTGLGLDEKQKDAVKALQTKTMKEMVRKRADAQIADIELRNLLEKDPVDMKAVEAAVKKSESFRTAISLMHISAREELKTILTPEQRKRMKETGMAGHGPGCMMGGDAEHKEMPMHEHMH